MRNAAGLPKKISDMCEYNKMSSCGIIYHIAVMAKMYPLAVQ